MVQSFKYRRWLITIWIIVLCVFVLVNCVDKEQAKPVATKDAGIAQFAGSKSCENCHKHIYDSHIKTAHYRASAPAIEKYIQGSFDNGKNKVAFSANVHVSMEKNDSNFYQIEYNNDKEKTRQRFDMVIGAGKKGQTYLSWMGNKLLQLPIFYFTPTQEWANSPGYPGKVIFNRVITSRCLECHSTYAQKNSAINVQPEEFAHNEVLYGIDCEKCHGPAAKHVAFEMQNKQDTTGKYIIKAGNFSRQQKLDMCAVCHAGSLNGTKPPFSFKAGDKLSEYYSYNTIAQDAESLDVHGNQFGLLSLSKCFIKSEMTCNSCHATHENEAGQVALFSQRCMSCHNKEQGNFCKFNKVPVATLTKNCIDCHMPEKESKTIVFLEQGTNKQVAASMRSHLIKVYPEQASKLLDFIKKGSR